MTKTEGAPIVATRWGWILREGACDWEFHHISGVVLFLSDEVFCETYAKYAVDVGLQRAFHVRYGVRR